MHCRFVLPLIHFIGVSISEAKIRPNRWDSTLREINLQGRPHVDTVVVVTHGLTMRLLLMVLNGWSPNTFHTVWNAENCAMYVLRRDLRRPSDMPYVVDKGEGDTSPGL